jgi:hypothetical protein
MMLHEKLLAEIRAEFPRFAIRYKRDSRLQRAIGVFLFIITFGGQRTYVRGYYTAMFGRLYVPDAWDRLADDDRYILLRHERVHLRQRRRMTGIGMAIVYLLLPLPFFLAYGRARLEWEAYQETIRATAEIHGVKAAEDLRAMIVRRYTSGEYAWMWPFTRAVNRWFDETIASLQR